MNVFGDRMVTPVVCGASFGPVCCSVQQEPESSIFTNDDFGYMPRGTNGALRHGILYNLSSRCQLLRTDTASNCFLFLGRRCVSRRTDGPNGFLAIRRSPG